MMLKIIGAKEEYFDEYYKIRCGESDIYWMGHSKAPDYNNLKACYLERLETASFSKIGDKRIFLINLSNKEDINIIGHIQLSLNVDGIEIGISVLEKYQGKNIGTQVIELAKNEALNYSNLIYAKIRDDNIASQHIFKKNGFERTDEYEKINYPKVGMICFRKYIHS